MNIKTKPMKKQFYILLAALLVIGLFASNNPIAKAESNDLQRGAWWGKIDYTSVIARKEPNSNSQRLGTFYPVNRVKVIKTVSGENIDGNDKWYQIDGGAHPGAYIFSGLVSKIDQPAPPQNLVIPDKVAQDEYWVDVDLTKQILTLAKGNTPVFVTYVSTGKSNSPTPKGSFSVWYKTRSVRMNLAPPVVPKAYDLPNVPDTMFYFRSYAIHGTYWHDKFGTTQSSGCTNLTQGDAEYIFSITNPVLPETQKALRVTSAIPSTVVVNHF